MREMVVGIHEISTNYMKLELRLSRHAVFQRPIILLGVGDTFRVQRRACGLWGCGGNKERPYWEASPTMMTAAVGSFYGIKGEEFGKYLPSQFHMITN